MLGFLARFPGQARRLPFLSVRVWGPGGSCLGLCRLWGLVSFWAREARVRSACAHLASWTLVASAGSGWRGPDDFPRDGDGCSADGDTSANGPRGHYHLHSCHGECPLRGWERGASRLLLPSSACPQPPFLLGLGTLASSRWGVRAAASEGQRAGPVPLLGFQALQKPTVRGTLTVAFEDGAHGLYGGRRLWSRAAFPLVTVSCAFSGPCGWTLLGSPLSLCCPALSVVFSG